MHPQRFIRWIRGLVKRGRVNCPKVCWRRTGGGDDTGLGGQEDSDADGRRGSGSGGRVAETPEELRKSGERGSGRRRREERRLSEGRYVDFERSDEGGVKGLS